MRWISTLTLLLALAGAAPAAGPDDDYLAIYNQMQQAEALQKGGQLPAAALQFLQARNALVKLQAAHPTSNAAAVNYRLDYLADKLTELAAYLPAHNAVPPPPQPAVYGNPRQQAAMWQEEIRALTNANAELEMKLKTALSAGQAAALQERISALTNENAGLNLKLKEALSIQPAAVAPDELDRAKKQIIDLEKERALLSAALEEQKAARAGAAKLKAAQKENDDLKKQLAAMTARPPSKSSGNKELDQLRARVAVLEATPVPYTAEELAVLKSAPSGSLPAPPVAAKEPSSKVHTAKDVPVGAGALMREARSDFLAHRFEDAEKKYADVLRQDEKNIFVLYNVGIAQFWAGRLDDCEKTVSRGLALDPNDPGFLCLLGMVRHDQKKLDDALDALSRSAAIDPANAGTQFYLGSTLADKGLRPQAETALRKALQLDPMYKEAHFNLAWLYALETPPSLALARWHYEKALDLGCPKDDALEKKLAAGK
jgi:hypothetical protein